MSFSFDFSGMTFNSPETREVMVAIETMRAKLETTVEEYKRVQRSSLDSSETIDSAMKKSRLNGNTPQHSPQKR
jgi:hypothetical protein